MDFLKGIWHILILFWPPNIIYIMQQGAQKGAAFRNTHGREPTEQEWKAMARRIDETM
jgi:hypothetical protein